MNASLALRSCAAAGIAAATLLVACGGGGGSHGTTPPVVDTTAPVVSLSAPVNLSSGLTGTITASAMATDDVGVQSVEFQLDGIALATLTSGPFQTSLDTQQQAAGQHVLRVRARDAAGNVSAWQSATLEFGGSGDITAGFTKNEAWVTGLANATAFAQAPDGRLFVCEQGGTLRVVKNGALLATPFHSFSVDSAGERGLLGAALHPDFANNGEVYVYYTSTSGGSHNRISRLVASAGNPDVSTSVESVLVDLPLLSSATNHNGGAIHFGSDGKLYAGVGDNANGAQSQDLTKVFGKILRFNDDGSIPGDGAFCSTASTQQCAVWAYGLRNPFTFAVEPGSGRIHINDVGQNTWEEIDVGAAGANYGWPGSEGPDTITSGVTAPLFAYKHSSASPPGSGAGGFFVGLAIAGGAFYPSGGSFPSAYQGNYFFADYLGQWVGRLDPANGNAAYAFANLAGTPVDMLVGIDGALYVLTHGGAITRISSP